MSEAATAISSDCRIQETRGVFPLRLLTPGAGWIYHITGLPLPDREFGGMDIAQLVTLRHNPDHPLLEIVDSECSQCSVPLRCSRFTAGKVACDVCIEKAKDAAQAERHEKYWSQEHICPHGSSFRDTDPKHAGFPKAQYEATKNYSGEESFFFFGPTGKGKSRLAMHLLKRCLFKYNRFVGVIWPEDLKHACKSFDRKDEIARWGKFDVLLMDDSLLTGAQDEKMTDFLKDLLDYRTRHGRHQIITSQIGGDDYEQQMKKYAEARGIEVTPADRRRVEALLRRLREGCRVISFADLTPKNGEEPF